MNNDRKRLGLRLLAAVAILVLIPMAVSAMGNSEKPYGAVLDEKFTELATDVESGQIDIKTAVDELNKLRVANNRPESDDYQEMERLLTRVMERQMTAIQARDRVRLMDECNVGEPANMVQNQEQNKNTVRTMESQSRPDNDSGQSAGSNAGGAGASQNGGSEKGRN